VSGATVRAHLRGDDRVDPLAIVARTARVYGGHARLLVAIGIAVFVPVALARAALGAARPVGLAVASALELGAMFVVQGAITWAVARMRTAPGTVPRVLDAVRAAPRWLPRLAAAGALAAAGIMAGLVAGVIPGLVLLTWWLVVAPVIVVEGRGVFAAFGRSRALVAGHGWAVFGVAVATLAAQLVLSLALAAGLNAVDAVAAGPLAVAIGSSIAAPWVATAWTLTYLDLRAAEER